MHDRWELWLLQCGSSPLVSTSINSIQSDSGRSNTSFHCFGCCLLVLPHATVDQASACNCHPPCIFLPRSPLRIHVSLQPGGSPQRKGRGVFSIRPAANIEPELQLWPSVSGAGFAGSGRAFCLATKQSAIEVENPLGLSSHSDLIRLCVLVFRTVWWNRFFVLPNSLPSSHFSQNVNWDLKSDPCIFPSATDLSVDQGGESHSPSHSHRRTDAT